MADSCPRGAIADGRKIARLVRTPEVQDLLPYGASDWGAGGCWLLAEALVATVYPGAKIKGVWENISGGKVMHHAVVEVDHGCYVDHDGAQSTQGLLKEMRKSIAEPYIASWHRSRARRTGMACDATALRELKAVLRREFQRGKR